VLSLKAANIKFIVIFSNIRFTAPEANALNITQPKLLQ